jgi:phosphoribosylformimino-5-aminoimidazole carboxamide ribotide isomerase
MQVIPVIDLLGGQVVRGIAGRRDQYRPIESRIAADSRPETVAKAFVEQFGFKTAYVADLDAIMHGRPDVRSWQEIAATGLELWLDAGTGDSERAWRLFEKTAAADLPVRLVVGLESLVSLDELHGICEYSLDRYPLFSLDLKGGKPITQVAAWQSLSPLEIALAVKQCCAGIIVLDLADVGTGGGTSTLPLCQRLRQADPSLRLIGGGGVRGMDDLLALAEAGCHAALVASALHDGRLTAQNVRNLGRRDAYPTA